MILTLMVSIDGLPISSATEIDFPPPASLPECVRACPHLLTAIAECGEKLDSGDVMACFCAQNSDARRGYEAACSTPEDHTLVVECGDRLCGRVKQGRELKKRDPAQEEETVSWYVSHRTPPTTQHWWSYVDELNQVDQKLALPPPRSPPHLNSAPPLNFLLPLPPLPPPPPRPPPCPQVRETPGLDNTASTAASDDGNDRAAGSGGVVVAGASIRGEREWRSELTEWGRGDGERAVDGEYWGE